MRKKADTRMRRRLPEAARALAESRPQDALNAARAAMRRRPRQPEPRLHAGIALARMGEREPCLRFIEEAARLGRGDAGIQCSAGRVFAELGRPDAAEACFHRACAIAPRDFAAHFGLAVMLERRQASKEAEAAYRQAAALQPGSAAAWVGLGNAEREQGRFEEAAASYRRAAAADPRHPPAWNNLGSLLRERGKADEAEAAYRTALNHVPGYAPGWTNLAALLGSEGRHEEAAAAWRKAAELEPGNVDAWSGLGSALARTGDDREAVPALERAVAAVTPEHPRVISLLGRLHAALAMAHLRADGTGNRPEPAEGGGKSGNPNRAEAKAAEAEVAAEAEASARAGAKARASAKAGAEALAVCDAWLDRRPGDATVLAAKAVILNELGRGGEARSLTDPALLAGCFRIDPAPDYPDLDRFNEALARYVASHPSLTWAPLHNATREGLHSGELVTESSGPGTVLKARILECIERYAAALAETDPKHLILRCRPPGIRMRMWGVVMHAGGHQIPHIHPAAWLSGVYYPEVPGFISADDPEHRGWIEFGRPPEEEFPDVRPMPVDAFRPEEGLLIVFPAWLYHRTVPYPADVRRISVAFDLVPSEPPDFGRLLRR